jgi:hypothetical protein
MCGPAPRIGGDRGPKVHTGRLNTVSEWLISRLWEPLSIKASQCPGRAQHNGSREGEFRQVQTLVRMRSILARECHIATRTQRNYRHYKEPWYTLCRR